jgi:acid phosphatase type 7
MIIHGTMAIDFIFQITKMLSGHIEPAKENNMSEVRVPMIRKISPERFSKGIFRDFLLLARSAILILPASLFFFACDTSPNRVPVPNHPLIAVYGDSRTNHDVHQRIVDAMNRLKPAAVFHCGDLVENGLKPEEWDTFNAITATLRQGSEFYPALGNHEFNSPLYFANFVLPGNERWYWVGIDGIHFVVLDTGSDLRVGSEQYNWLEELLAGIDPADLVVSVFHHPPFSAGPHIPDEKKLLESIVPLFEKYDIDLVFSAHDHAYQRFSRNRIQYVVSGGGGAPLHDQARTSPYLQLYLKAYHFCTLKRQDDGLIVDIFGIDSQRLDSFVVNP